MATVGQLVEDIADVFKEKPEKVNAYARALIDSGDLPKSKGRAVAQVDYQHIVKLFLAVILSPKIKNTADNVGSYYHMRGAGVMPSFPASVQSRAGEQLCNFVRVIFNPESDEGEFRKELIASKIIFTLNWLEIEFDFSNADVMRFKEGGNPQGWDGYFKRSVILSGSAFSMLGFAKGRDYFTTGGDE